MNKWGRKVLILTGEWFVGKSVIIFVNKELTGFLSQLPFAFVDVDAGVCLAVETIAALTWRDVISVIVVVLIVVIVIVGTVTML